MICLLCAVPGHVAACGTGYGSLWRWYNRKQGEIIFLTKLILNILMITKYLLTL